MAKLKFGERYTEEDKLCEHCGFPIIQVMGRNADNPAEAEVFEIPHSQDECMKNLQKRLQALEEWVGNLDYLIDRNQRDLREEIYEVDKDIRWKIDNAGFLRC